MLQKARELEKKLKLEPINLELFGVTAVERARAIRYYLLDLVALAERNNNSKKEKENAQKELPLFPQH